MYLLLLGLLFLCSINPQWHFSSAFDSRLMFPNILFPQALLKLSTCSCKKIFIFILAQLFNTKESVSNFFFIKYWVQKEVHYWFKKKRITLIRILCLATTAFHPTTFSQAPLSFLLLSCWIHFSIPPPSSFTATFLRASHNPWREAFLPQILLILNCDQWSCNFTFF